MLKDKGRPKYKPQRPRGPLGEKIFVQCLGFFCCVCLPLLVSAMAPISVVQLTWINERVQADLTTRSFYFLTYRHRVVSDVLTVDDRFHEGDLVRDHHNDRRSEHRAEDESFLVLHGRENTEEVSVSPANIRATVDRARDFLAHPNPTGLRLTVVANWKFGVIVPLILSPLLLLYLTGVLLAFVHLFLPRKKKT